jgi:hypothetical protein
VHKRGVVGYSKKSALLEEAITHMNTGKYGRSSAALKELLALDPHNTEARRLFATLHLRLGSLVTARQAFESLANEAIGRQDYWLAESLLREYLAAGPRCVPFLELLAHVYQEKGDEMAAVGELGKAIEILRDDPDSENPQKAAQFYSKIRELAPASTVALELAPLFDVQTGEFLVRPSTTQAPVSGNEEGLHESAVSAAEHSLPEVMPWEVIDESSSASDSQPSSTSLTGDQVADSSLCETEDQRSALENQRHDGSDLLSSTTVSLSDELSVSHDELSSNGAASTLEASEPEAQELSSERVPESHPELETASGNGIPSPMPWEQMADASIQISEPEAPSPSDPHLALESILASFREQDGLAAPAPVAFEESTPVIEIAEPAVPPVSMEPAPLDSSSTLSSPMPWEQVSDAAMQIPEGEYSPQPTSSFSLQEPFSLSSSPTEEVLSSSSSLAFDPVPTDGADSAPALTDLDRSSSHDEQSRSVISVEAEPVPDTHRVASFSWNSVFDKAWKLAAGTMAPSSERELERDAGSIREEDSASEVSPSPISIVPDMAPAPLMPADSPAPELSPFVPQSFSDAAPPASATPAMPASFSTVIEEQTIPEVETGSPSESTEPEPVSVENRSAEESRQAMSDPPNVADPPSEPDGTTPPAGAPSHWNTGEVAVQVHRPSKKKQRWDKEPENVEQAPAIPASALESLSETLSQAIREWKSTPVEAAGASVTEEAAPTQDESRPDWMQASEAITFDAPASPPPTMKSWSDSEVISAPQTAEQAHAAAASAVDVLFSPNRADDSLAGREHPAWSRPRPRFMARLHRIRIGVSSFIGSCFSTTRSLTFLALMLTITTVVVATAGVGALGLAWMAMEVPPSALYHNLTITPPRVVTDAKKNGYLLLLGFDAPVGQDPVQTGYERKADERDSATAQVCMGGDDAKDGSGSAGASAHVVKGWFRSADPAAQIKGQGDTIRSLANRESTAMARYQRWLTMPFDDWGYGQLLSPNCAHVLLAHRLFLLEGFNQDLATGLDRLEDDFQSWRTALAQSKTLMVKMLAVTAVQDDASVASGLLSRSDLDGTSLGRLSRMVRPLDQVELSVRWPMQSHFVWATKSLPAEIKQDKSHDRPWYISTTAAMRLPIQRRANAYAEYYEATNKAVAGGRYTNLPKLSSFVRTPATGLMDYLANPVEHIVGIEPLPSWDPYVMRMIETDAQLRLVGLQAWLRRGPQEGDILMRLAKAGQAYYDPFTGLPMLVNQRKGLIYSVGRDGKDQEGDRVYDVAVAIPSGYSSSSDSRGSRTSSPSR